MKKILLIIISFAALALSGCASKPYYGQIQSIDAPDVGLVTTKSLGEPIVEYSYAQTKDSFSVHTPLDLKGGLLTMEIGTYVKVADASRYDEYMAVSPTAGMDSGFTLHKTNIYLDKTNNTVCNYDVLYFCTDENAPVSIKPRTVEGADSQFKEMIYTGKHGSKVNFMYREFTNNMIRGAFTVPVEYDLTEGKVISYKGAEFEIIEATNRHLKYIVRKHFTPLSL
ncbi:putative lipoprotein [Vibrio campbellii]|uniref:putative lipoprotein n=1 Tax=Vibrio campbellii TaxID=680 RepID=UPI00015438E6|nr:putative lipoprotein [Vibrio campbellii]EDL70473.1 putative lipoprotein [Vibrio campbellii HY01]MCC8251816.1 hypothetical protein [Vibrio campbellii CAIM 333]